MIQGEPVTERDIENWADEAAQGYDLDRLRKRGRKPVGDGPGQVIPVRLDKTLLAALGRRLTLRQRQLAVDPCDEGQTPVPGPP